MPPTKFKQEYIFRVYQLAKQGLSQEEIAAFFEVEVATMHDWFARNSAFRQAWEEGKAPPEQELQVSGATFSDYVYQQLSPELQDLYDELINIWGQKNAQAQIQLLTADCGKRAHQALFVHALAMHAFSLTRALQICGVSRGTFNQWCKEREFGILIDELNEFKKDWYEDKFIGLVREGNDKAIIHAAKTVLRDRGYGDVLTVRAAGQDGEWMLDDLPIEDREKLLTSIEQAEAEMEREEISE